MNEENNYYLDDLEMGDLGASNSDESFEKLEFEDVLGHSNSEDSRSKSYFPKFHGPSQTQTAHVSSRHFSTNQPIPKTLTAPLPMIQRNLYMDGFKFNMTGMTPLNETIVTDMEHDHVVPVSKSKKKFYDAERPFSPNSSSNTSLPNSGVSQSGTGTATGRSSPSNSTHSLNTIYEDPISIALHNSPYPSFSHTSLASIDNYSRQQRHGRNQANSRNSRKLVECLEEEVAAIEEEEDMSFMLEDKHNDLDDVLESFMTNTIASSLPSPAPRICNNVNTNLHLPIDFGVELIEPEPQIQIKLERELIEQVENVEVNSLCFSAKAESELSGFKTCEKRSNTEDFIAKLLELEGEEILSTTFNAQATVSTVEETIKKEINNDFEYEVNEKEKGNNDLKKSKYETKMEKRHKRMIRNRISAQQHRERKKQHVDELEDIINELRGDNERLLERVTQVQILSNEFEAENKKLKEQNQKLLQLIESLQKENSTVEKSVPVVPTESATFITPLIVDLNEEENMIASKEVSTETNWNDFRVFVNKIESQRAEASETGSLLTDRFIIRTSNDTSKKQRTGDINDAIVEQRSKADSNLETDHNDFSDLKLKAKRKAKTLASHGSKLLMCAFVFAVSFVSVNRRSTNPNLSLDEVGVDSAGRNLMSIQDYSLMDTNRNEIGNNYVFPDLTLEPLEAQTSTSSVKNNSLEAEVVGYKNFGLTLRVKPNQEEETVTPKRDLGKLQTHIDGMYLLAEERFKLPTPHNKPSTGSMSLDLQVDDVFSHEQVFREKVYEELSKLAEILKTHKLLMEMTQKNGLNGPDKAARAVALYKRPDVDSFAPNNDVMNSEILRIEAVHTALSSYLKYLKVNSGFDGYEDQRNHHDSIIFCPSAYGALHDLKPKLASVLTQTVNNLTSVNVKNSSSDVDDSETGSKSKRSRLRRRQQTKYETMESRRSLINQGNESVLQEFPKVTIIVPTFSYKNQYYFDEVAQVFKYGPNPNADKRQDESNDDSFNEHHETNEIRLLELTCSVESMKEILSPHYNL